MNKRINERGWCPGCLVQCSCSRSSDSQIFLLGKETAGFGDKGELIKGVGEHSRQGEWKGVGVGLGNQEGRKQKINKNSLEMTAAS